MIPLDPALLRAVLDAPEDDTIRLVAADWFEEHGDIERAEFVRIQCRLAFIDGELQDAYNCNEPTCLCAKRQPLRERERELLLLWEAGGQRNGIAWSCLPVDLLRRPVQVDAWQKIYQFRRGFVESLTLTAADWLAHADAITAAQPIREVTLTTWPVSPKWPHFVALGRITAENELREKWPTVKTWILPKPPS